MGAGSSKVGAGDIAKPREDNPYTKEPLPGEEEVRLPEPCPPSTSKLEIFNVHLYDKIHKHVKTVPNTWLNATFEELSYHITKTNVNDMERVRAIFSWLTSFDVSTLMRGIKEVPKEGSPLEYLRKIHKKKGNKAFMFSYLCLAAGVPCVLITGINKSSAYQIGNPIVKSKLQAQWNAVLVDGQWRLVDTFWGSCVTETDDSNEWALLGMNDLRPETAASFRAKSNTGFISRRASRIPGLHDADQTTSSQATDGTVLTDSTVINIQSEEGEEGEDAAEDFSQYLVNEFFFLTDPKMLISTHLPDDEKWQMLESPITIERFEKQAYLRDRFFDLDATLIDTSLHDCMNKTPTGEIDITFGIPSAMGHFLQFTFLIYQERGTELPDPDIPLERYVLYQKKTDSVQFTVQFPVAGRFKVDIFGMHNLNHKFMELVASYLVDAKAKKNAEPLPDMPEIGWGAGPEMEDAGLKSEQESAIIETHDGTVELRFQKSNPLSVLQAMRNNHLDDWLLKKVAVLREEGDEVIVNVRLPEPGEYAFKLYADDPEHEGQLANVCNYLLKSVNPNATPELFPKLHNGVLGSSKDAEALEVKPISHPEGIIKTEDGKLRITFSNPPNVELMLQLTSDNIKPETLAHSIRRIEEDGQTTFEVDIPEAGEFGINVYGQNKGGETAVIHHVHSYLVDSTQTERLITPQERQKSEIPLREFTTTRDSYKIRLPDGDFENPLVANISREAALDPMDDTAVVMSKQAGADVFKVQLPELGKYVMNVFEKTANGALMEVEGVQITRRSLMPGEEAEEDEDAIERRLLEEKYAAELKALRSAVKSMDTMGIAKSIAAIKAKGDVPDLLKREVTDAQNLLDYMKHRDALNHAMGKRSIEDLEKAIEAAERASPSVRKKLDSQLKLAKKMLEQLRRIEKLRHDIMELNQRTIAEIRSYSTPPDPVFKVMKTTFIILGETEAATKQWKDLQALIGKTGKISLKRRVQSYDVSSMTIATLKFSRKLLRGLDLDQLREASSGAARFYVWAAGMMEEADFRFSQSGIDTGS